MLHSATSVLRSTHQPFSTIKLVIFDCDGVLIDSETLSEKVLTDALGEIGVHVDHAYFKANFLGRSFPKVAQNIRETFNIKLPETFEADYRQTLLTTFNDNLQPVHGIEDVLGQLAVVGCVATSSSPQRVSRSLAITKLDRFFDDRIFTASQVANGKPAPDLFLLAANTFGIAPSQCLVIEDSVPGLKAAQAAGMQVLHFIGASHLDISDTLTHDVSPPPQHFSAWPDLFTLAPKLKQSQ